jgi:ABC-type multidrug transport system ATPase subunit
MTSAPEPPVEGGGPLVRFAGVQKRYGRRFRLEVDDLTLAAGDRILVLGANGSGKSTFLRTLIGAARPDAGQVWRASAMHAARSAYVPQTGGLYGELTVADNLSLRRWLYGVAQEPAEQNEVVRRLGLEKVLHTRARALSGGYHRLTALAAALQLAPTALVLDEPFGDLDATAIATVHALLEEQAARLMLLVIAMPAPIDGLPINRRLQLQEGTLACVAC